MALVVVWSAYIIVVYLLDAGGPVGLWEYYASTPSMLLFPVGVVATGALAILALSVCSPHLRKEIIKWAIRAGTFVVLPAFLVVTVCGVLEPGVLMLIWAMLVGGVGAYWWWRLILREPTRRERIITLGVIVGLLCVLGFMLWGPDLGPRWSPFFSRSPVGLAEDTPESEAIVAINLTAEMDFDRWYPTYVRLSYRHRSSLVRSQCIEVLREKPRLAIADLRRKLPELEGVNRERAEEAIRRLETGVDSSHMLDP